MGKIKDWWDERDDAEKRLIIFGAGCTAALGLGCFIGSRHERHRAAFAYEKRQIDLLKNTEQSFFVDKYDEAGNIFFSMLAAKPGGEDQVNTTYVIGTPDDLEKAFTQVIDYIKEVKGND